ncbi:MAG TPA: PfkB family carbohydrate kinase [Chloroflexota bacterium]|nr:PfkB family carbohydrate kinase [Chloroflexota bacterium]
MKLVAVGSVALDTLETPFGRADEALGGSAVYFSLAARHFSPVGIVGVVGTDFPRPYVDLLVGRGVDVTGLASEEGQTFRWSGRYDFDLNTAHTLDTQLNVFAGFSPHLPESYRRAEYLFLGNIDPDLQLDVLKQIRRPKFAALDTMNFWISGKRDALTEVIRQVDAVLINEAEARQYANTYNLLKASRDIRALGPQVVVVKKGEYGCVLFAEDSYFVTPAYPLEAVKDPTGAGDSFAGAFMGFLARAGRADEATLRRAIVHGSVVASYACEEFSVGRLTTLDDGAIARRYAEFRRITHFEDERE